MARRHLWLLKTIFIRHRCLIYPVSLTINSESLYFQNITYFLLASRRFRQLAFSNGRCIPTIGIFDQYSPSQHFRPVHISIGRYFRLFGVLDQSAFLTSRCFNQSAHFWRPFYSILLFVVLILGCQSQKLNHFSAVTVRESSSRDTLQARHSSAVKFESIWIQMLRNLSPSLPLSLSPSLPLSLSPARPPVPRQRI
jgi:hypothetical protein